MGNGYESDGDPYAERSGWFRLSPSAVRRFSDWDAQHAVSSAPSSTARWCVERVGQNADFPVPLSALRRCTEREV